MSGEWPWVTRRTKIENTCSVGLSTSADWFVCIHSLGFCRLGQVELKSFVINNVSETYFPSKKNKDVAPFLLPHSRLLSVFKLYLERSDAKLSLQCELWSKFTSPAFLETARGIVTSIILTSPNFPTLRVQKNMHYRRLRHQIGNSPRSNR